MTTENEARCGACQTILKDVDIEEHLENCIQASVLYPIYLQILAGNDSAGHKCAFIFNQSTKNHYLIDKYAACIAYEFNTLERVDAHIKLCEALGLDYKTFKPFEADDIDKLPTFEEAKTTIWKALFTEMWNNLAPVQKMHQIIKNSK